MHACEIVFSGGGAQVAICPRVRVRCERSYQGQPVAHHAAAASHDARALPNHAHDGAAGEEARQGGKERLVLQVRIMRLGHGLGGRHHLQGHELVALGFKAGDDLTDEAALHRIGLERDEGALLGSAGHAHVGGGGRAGNRGARQGEARQGDGGEQAGTGRRGSRSHALREGEGSSDSETLVVGVTRSRKGTGGRGAQADVARWTLALTAKERNIRRSSLSLSDEGALPASN